MFLISWQDFFSIIFDECLKASEGVTSCAKSQETNHVNKFIFATIDGESAKAEAW
jgi:hypothetical protein